MLTQATKDRFLEILEEYITSNGIDVFVEVEEEPQHGTTITRHDVIRMKDDERWFCFSFIIDSEERVGVWTRGHIEILEGPYGAARPYEFDEASFPEWLESQFMRDFSLKQLTDA